MPPRGAQILWFIQNQSDIALHPILQAELNSNPIESMLDMEETEN